MIETLANQHFSLPEIVDHIHPTNANKKYLVSKADLTEYAPIQLMRWRSGKRLPETIPMQKNTAVGLDPHFYEYNDDSDWYVNFADQQWLGYAEGSLFAQEEIIAAEHPHLYGIRNRMLQIMQESDGLGGKRTQYAPLTHTDTEATPIICKGVPRLLDIDTWGLYGNLFALADDDSLDENTTVLTGRTTNLISMAAMCVRTPNAQYTAKEIEYHLRTAYTAFAGAVYPNDPGVKTIHSGNWGCGAFGGNKVLMYIIQIIAANWARVDQLILHDAYIDDMVEADQVAKRIRGEFTNKIERGLDGEWETTTNADAVIEELASLNYCWNASNGT